MKMPKTGGHDAWSQQDCHHPVGEGDVEGSGRRHRNGSATEIIKINYCNILGWTLKAIFIYTPNFNFKFYKFKFFKFYTLIFTSNFNLLSFFMWYHIKSINYEHFVIWLYLRDNNTVMMKHFQNRSEQINFKLT